MGVPGSDVQRGLRWESCGIVLYVDNNHPGATVVGDGTNPEYPLTTIQEAVNTLIAHATAMAISLEGSVIVVAAEATIAETVIIPATAPANCVIMGSGNQEWGPTWTSAAAAANALTIRRPGWTVTGFRFIVPSAAAAICLDHDGATTASDRTRIVGNDFDGLWAGRYGVYYNGGPDQVFVSGNRFHELNNAGQASFAIYIANTGWANPYLWAIEGNYFFENDNNIGQPADDRSFNVSLFKDNVFTQGVLNPTAIQLDLRGGSRGENTVMSNFFGGDYSNTGGYYAHAVNPGSWVGNIAEDLAEPEVADNGFTVAVPSP